MRKKKRKGIEGLEALFLLYFLDICLFAATLSNPVDTVLSESRGPESLHQTVVSPLQTVPSPPWYKPVGFSQELAGCFCPSFPASITMNDLANTARQSGSGGKTEAGLENKLTTYQLCDPVRWLHLPQPPFPHLQNGQYQEYLLLA